MIKVASLELGASFIEDLNQSSCGQVFRNIALQDIAEAGAGSDRSRGEIAIIAEEGAGGADLHLPSIALELPGQKAAGDREAITDAVVCVEILRCFGLRMARAVTTLSSRCWSILELDLLSNPQRVVDIDTKIANCTL